MKNYSSVFNWLLPHLPCYHRVPERCGLRRRGPKSRGPDSHCKLLLVTLAALLCTGCLDEVTETIEAHTPEPPTETTIDAGGPYIMALGETINLSATIRLGENATLHDISWQVRDNNEAVSLTESTSFQPVVTGLTGGTVIVEARLRYDLDGGPVFLRTALDTADIHIVAASN